MILKKLTKKQQIFLTIIGCIIGVLLISAILIYKLNATEQKDEVSYKIIKIKKSDPLVLKGIVQPKTTSYLNYDQSLGKINTISVKNGQEINENDVVATYQNTTVEDQAEEQTQSLEKLNLAVTNAQINLDNATQKQQELENRLTIAKNEQTTIINKKMDDEMKKAEKAEVDSKIETIQQSLDAANVDLSSANNTIEQTKKKITTTVTAPFKGIVYINDKGKVDAAVPYATILSPETVIKGSVTEYDYNKVKVGQPVTISQINEEKATDGIITEINALPEEMAVSPQDTSSTKNSTISTFSFIISPKEPIHYGYNVQISVPMNNLELAKKNTVKENNNEVFVFIYRDGKVVKQKIEVKEDNNKYVVKTGLKENDSIVEKPDTSLKDGQKVTVKQ
ncbi:TPA: efflux RND transporter periplasmic adaptor subunit [Enterococcus faecalis]|nr:efflux RND transporter periplasmic adaptor subunit [Enterococcus faecalis]